MDLYEAIKKRRTIRDFEDKEVDHEVIEKIIQAGLKAPTNDHMRNWEFVVISDKEEKAKLIATLPKNMSKSDTVAILDHWKLTDEKQRKMYMDGIPKQFTMLYNASCLILPFFKQDWPLLHPESISSLNPFASIWMCIENILLAATAEGLYGVVRIPAAEGESEYIKQIIGHPDNYIMPCYISLGYLKSDAIIHEQYEYDAKEKIHINKW